jgi:hypothetical protein
MSRKSGRAQATVERLLEQRRQYREWLARLGPDAVAQFPRAVAERVRADYRQRRCAFCELCGHERIEFLELALISPGRRLREPSEPGGDIG